MGGGGPSKPKPTQSEIATAQQSGEDFNNWAQNYIPLEQKQVADVENADTVQADKQLLRDRAGADASQAGAKVMEGAAQSDLMQGKQGTEIGRVHV